jgi:hypothetical protein
VTTAVETLPDAIETLTDAVESAADAVDTVTTAVETLSDAAETGTTAVDTVPDAVESASDAVDTVTTAVGTLPDAVESGAEAVETVADACEKGAIIAELADFPSLSTTGAKGAVDAAGPPSFVKWGKKVFQWIRRKAPEWNQYKGYRVTTRVKEAIDRGVLQLAEY